MRSILDLQYCACDIARKYDALNAKKGNHTWGPKDRALGLVTDTGELAELVMAKEGMRQIDDVDTKLAHELSDCLWSILVLADSYNINLEQAFMRTVSELDERIKKAMA